MPKAALLAVLLAAAQVFPANAQGSWGDLDHLILSSLGTDPAIGSIEGSLWIPDSADASAATEALAFLYFGYATGGNAVGILIGHFTKNGGNWHLRGRVNNLFGTNPREQSFLPDRIEVTTTILQPGEPRCCPTGVARWMVNRSDLLAVRLP